jgi:protein ImuB
MVSPKYRVCCALISEQASAESRLRDFTEACFRFTPQIAVREGEAIFLEVGKSHLLFSEEGLRRRMEVLARRFELKVSMGFGDSAGEALAIARCGAAAALPLRALRDFASPFARDEELEKQAIDVVRKLGMLGFRGLEDFRRFPSAGLASRFGQVASLLSARVRGEQECSWPEFRRAEQVCESVDIEEDVSLQSLVFILRGLCDRALSRLWAKCERASVIEVKFDLSKWSTLASHERMLRVELPLPQATSVGLIPIIQEQMARVSLDAPVVKVSFSVVEAVPGNGAQRDFFNKTEQEKEAWNALVGRLSYKLGNGRVFVALPVERYLPERAWKRGIEMSMRALLPEEFPVLEEAKRPARLLRKPEPIEKEGDTLIHLRTGREWRIVDWEGPERLSGEWWMGLESRKFGGFQRDYFQVIAKGGEELWIFYNKGWFLHGYFD